MPLSRRSLIAAFSGIAAGSLSAPGAVLALEALGTEEAPLTSQATEWIEPPGAEEAKPVQRALRIAMLMPPDESPFLAAARIVANGLAAPNAAGRQVEILLIESATPSGGIDAALEAALASGADITVGPIERDAVELLARRTTLPIPVLALNVPDNVDFQSVPQNLSMLSISTEREAEWIAKAAVEALPPLTNNGTRPKAAIVAGDAQWQTRIRDAFERVLVHAQIDFEVVAFAPEFLDDIQTKFEPTLSADEAAQFDEELREALAKATTPQQRKLITKRIHSERRARVTQSEPPFQTVLLALSAQEAALVRNRFPRGTRVWATSAVNPGDPASSSAATTLAYDLDGTVFPECPIVVELNAKAFEERFSASMPYSTSAKRLFALGVDARAAALAWAQGQSFEDMVGCTGKLSFNRAQSPIVDRIPQTVVVQDGMLLEIPRDLASRTVLPKVELPKPEAAPEEAKPIEMPAVKEDIGEARREGVKGLVLEDDGMEFEPTPMLPPQPKAAPALAAEPAASGFGIAH